MAGKNKHNLADPTWLARTDGKKNNLRQVVIETPKGSRNKYAYDTEQRIFQLKKVLPAGMTFPYDFGFVPSTIAEDGDPIDVLVLMDEPAFAGCLLECRIIGIIEGKQGTKNKTERNDRVVAIEKANHSFAQVKHVDDLGRKFVEELEEFFVNYHELSGEQFRVLGVRGPKEALKRIEKCAKASKKDRQ